MAYRTPFAHLLPEAAVMSVGSGGKNQGWREAEGLKNVGEHRGAGAQGSALPGICLTLPLSRLRVSRSILRGYQPRPRSRRTGAMQSTRPIVLRPPISLGTRRTVFVYRASSPWGGPHRDFRWRRSLVVALTATDLVPLRSVNSGAGRFQHDQSTPASKGTQDVTIRETIDASTNNERKGEPCEN